jgi:hypothetical protein
MKQYYIYINDEQIGPLSFEDVSSKKISKETKVWFEGLDDWKNAGEIEELSSIIKSTPPPINSFSSQTTPPKFVEKEESKIETEDEEVPKILGLKKNVFYTILSVLLVVIGLIYFNNLQENNRAILLEQNRQTESYNQQQKEIEEQKARIAEQEQIEAERKIQERKEALENRHKELNDELTILYKNLNIAQKNLNDVTGFKLLRTSSERNEQINSAQSKIDAIKERIRTDEEEMKKINTELGIQ